MMNSENEVGVRMPATRGRVGERARIKPHGLGRACLATIWLVWTVALGQSVHAAGSAQPKMRRIPTQYIAALGEPGASSGSGAQTWGLWPVDPGPRGVELDDYGRLTKAGGVAPARWKFDGTDWWLEEHGLIMEKPEFPLSPRKYLVTGGRGTTAVLTVHPVDPNGNGRWKLDGVATLHDVTHLACRSARYRPMRGGGSCSPASVQRAAFPVAPGGEMPPVEGCTKQDYSVLIVIGVEVQD